MKSSKEKRALIAGMIGCLLYVIGDFLFAATGKTQSTESIGLMVKVAYLDMATWRMVVSIICGVLGTALYYIGFHQMWKLLKRHLTQPKQQKWVKLFQIAYLTGTVCWGYVHAMFTNRALFFKFTFEKYGDMQAAAEIANKVFYCNAAPLLAAYILCDVLLSVVMLVMIWKRMLPLKNTAQRILASFCNPIVFTGIVGNLFTLLPWPLDQIDHGTESAGHLLKYGTREHATPSSAVRTLRAYSPYRPFASSTSHEAAERFGSISFMVNSFRLHYAARCFFTTRLPIIVPIKAATITPATSATDTQDCSIWDAARMAS